MSPLFDDDDDDDDDDLMRGMMMTRKVYELISKGSKRRRLKE